MDRRYSIWQLKYFHPKFLGVWLFILFMYLSSRLPWKLQLGLGKGLGKLLYRVAKRRRHITKVNVNLCYPNLTDTEKNQLVKKIFEANSIGYMETSIAWFNNLEKYRSMTKIEGMEHLKEAKENGKGVLLTGAHFSMLDLAGGLTSLFFELNVTYRPLDNPLMNEIMMQGRQRFCTRAFHKKDVKGFIKFLKKQGVLWYAPDQDYGRRSSVFADFFGISTATVTGTTWLAKAGNAVVLPYSYLRNSDNSGWTLKIWPPLDIPSESEADDARKYNIWLEQILKQNPEQYLWLHKRFKTRPDPKDPKFY